AFIADKIDPQGLTVGRRNPDHDDGGRPYVDAVEYTVTPDAESQKNAFRAGSLEFIPPGSITLAEVEQLKRTNPSIVVQMAKALGNGSDLGLKMDRPPFDDIR